jgi:hypothetical protein
MKGFPMDWNLQKEINSIEVDLNANCNWIYVKSEIKQIKVDIYKAPIICRKAHNIVYSK